MRRQKMLITVFAVISCFFLVGGESTGTTTPKCPDYDFQCLDGRCIPRTYVCDGFDDCSEGEDEKGCLPTTQYFPVTTKKCSSTEFECLDGFCIPKYRVCDGYADCNQGEDEIGCTTPACQSYEFQCWDGECIPKYFVCNSYPDCSQGEDEIGCITTTVATTPACTSTEFQCWDGQCIPGYFVCNDYPDCSQGEDEIDCGNSTRYRHNPIMEVNAKCESFQYKCMDGQCINKYYVCDGFVDCSQGEDEKDCSYTSWYPVPETTKGCSQDEYRCLDGKCIPNSYLCDGFRDCQDGEDERDCLSTRPTAPPTTTKGCSSDQFECWDGVCISDYYVCDGVKDCHQGEDELGCSSPTVIPTTTPGCDETQFQCWDGKCIPLSWVCDGAPGCSQGEDELHCSTTYSPESTTSTPPPPVCEHPYDIVGDRCIMIDPVVAATWDEARYLCERFDGDLVIIDSIVFFSKLIQYIKDNGLISRDYWIGATDRDREGEWKWINGANVLIGTPLWAVYGSGTSTYEQEPRSGSDSDCGYLDKARFYYMDDFDCLKTKATICQIPTWSEEDPAFIPKVEIVDEERKKEIFEMAKIFHQ